MKPLIWRDDPRSLPPSKPGESYAGVLKESSLSASASRSVAGILIALIAYTVVLPGVATMLLGICWLVGGKPGVFADYQQAGLSYETIVGMISSHLAVAALIVVSMLVVRFVHWTHPAWLSSVQPGFRWRYAVVSFIAAAVLLNVVFWLTNAGEMTWHMDAQAVWWILAVVLTSPLQAAGEEFFFRGYLLQACGSFARRPWFAVVISALVFAFMHGVQNGALFADRFAFGLIAGGLVVLTGGLEASIAIHAANNVFALAYAAASTGIAAARAMQQSTWTTTAWNTVAYLLAAAVCWFIASRYRVATRTPNLQ